MANLVALQERAKVLGLSVITSTKVGYKILAGGTMLFHSTSLEEVEEQIAKRERIYGEK